MLGNQYLAQLSAYTWWTLRVDMWDFSGNYAWAQYSNFSVSGVTTDYTLTTLGTFTGTAGKYKHASQLDMRDYGNGIKMAQPSCDVNIDTSR